MCVNWLHKSLYKKGDKAITNEIMIWPFVLFFNITIKTIKKFYREKINVQRLHLTNQFRELIEFSSRNITISWIILSKINDFESARIIITHKYQLEWKSEENRTNFRHITTTLSIKWFRQFFSLATNTFMTWRVICRKTKLSITKITYTQIHVQISFSWIGSSVEKRKLNLIIIQIPSNHNNQSKVKISHSQRPNAKNLSIELSCIRKKRIINHENRIL